jgi:hypothetical protein
MRTVGGGIPEYFEKFLTTQFLEVSQDGLISLEPMCSRLLVLVVLMKLQATETVQGLEAQQTIIRLSLVGNGSVRLRMGNSRGARGNVDG